MSQLFGAGSANPFGTPGPAASPYTNPFKNPTQPLDRNLFEQDQGRPALGYYAATVGAGGPFRDWLEKDSTQHQMYTDYEGVYASRQNPSYAYTDYLAEFDPYQRFMQLPPEARGEASPGQVSPFVQLLNL